MAVKDLPMCYVSPGAHSSNATDGFKHMRHFRFELFLSNSVATIYTSNYSSEAMHSLR